MTWTIDRTSGADFIASTEIVAGPTATSTIYLPGTNTVVSNVSVTGFEWFTATDLALFQGNGASDTLLASDNNDLVVWDAGTLNNFLFSDIVSLGRARLPTANANQRIEVFDLGAGDDLLNMTANTASLAGGASPGVYNFAFTAYGDTGNDTIAAGEQGDLLFGDGGIFAVGSDVVWGFAGDDTIFGDNGSAAIDELVGAADTLRGGAGTDIIHGEGGDDSLEGEAGTDTLFGGGGNDRLFGGADASIDTLFGASGNDTAYGGDGADIISGSTGLDTLYGGAGADSFAFNPDNGQGLFDFVVSLWSGEGPNPGTTVTIPGSSSYNWSNDIFIGGADIDTISLTNGNDLLLFNTGDLSIGGVGNPIASGRFTEVEVIVGGGGNDIIQLNNATGGDVFDPLAHTLFGGGGADILVAALGNDIVVGHNVTGAAGAGDTDTLYGGGGNDTLFGDTFDQTVGFGGGADTLYGGGGIDTAFGGGGNDLILGDSAGTSSAAGDSLYGGLGDDTIFGAGGADVVSGDEGADSLFGGGGLDELRFSADIGFEANGNDLVRVWTGEGGNPTFTHVLVAGSTTASLDSFAGDGGTDTLVGENGANVIFQNLGDLTIDGVDQADSGGRLLSTEVFVLGGGNDVLLMNDSERNEVWSSAVTAFGGALADLLVTGSANDLLVGGDATGGVGSVTDADTLFGGAGNDTLFGDVQGNSASSGGGVDTLYGGSGDDSIFADAGNDLLFGGAGIDSFDGGDGNDTIAMFADNTTVGAGGNDFVQGWDGEGSTARFGFDGLTVNWSFDRFDGGASDLDTLVGTAGNDIVVSNTNDIYIDEVGQTGNPTRLAGIELVLLGAGADMFMANDPNLDSPAGTVFATAISVSGGDGADTIITGAGTDVLWGNAVGVTAGSGDGANYLAAGAGFDTLFGADGIDRLFGGSGDDSMYGGDGNDTAYGGAGQDRIEGGNANDLLIDGDDAQMFGGNGADILLLALQDLGSSESGLFGGDDAFGDGNDLAYVTGFYAKVDAALGAGNDTFISYAIGDDGMGNSGDRVDRVSGQSGDDLVSTWFGDDSIDGGDGNDALWGGAGGDTVIGGPGTDYIYGGEGNNDQLFGGAGTDYYYWARIDGTGDQIFDEFRVTTVGPGAGDNVLSVYAGYDVNGVLPAGTGVFETDGTITDSAGGDDMVRAFDVDGAGSGTIWRLEVLQGAGTGAYVEFDQRDIDSILLWNHDATAGTPVITTYEWNGSTYVLI